MWITFLSGSVLSLRGQWKLCNALSTWLAPGNNLQILIVKKKKIIKTVLQVLIYTKELRLLCFLDPVCLLGICAKVHRLGCNAVNTILT